MRAADPNDASAVDGWPSDMVIRFADSPKSLVDLLWLRHHFVEGAGSELPAADLPSRADVPGRADMPSLGRCRPVAVPGLVQRWEAEWRLALAQLLEIQQTDPTTMANRSDLWDSSGIDSLAEELGTSLAAAAVWRRDGIDSPRELDAAVIPALRQAWERGLSDVVELPLRGPFAESISSTTLIVSVATRADPERFGAALLDHGATGLQI